MKLSLVKVVVGTFSHLLLPRWAQSATYNQAKYKRSDLLPQKFYSSQYYRQDHRPQSKIAAYLKYTHLQSTRAVNTKARCSATMSLKRKKEESFEEGLTRVTYASESEWLKCLFHKTSASYAGTKESEEGSRLIIEGCKLVYILYHDIEAYDSLESLIQSLHRSAERNSKISLMREAKVKQSGWKGQILNKFFLPHVKELKRKWEVAHPYAAFVSLPEKERVRLWMEAYDAEPKSMIAKMFKPVIMALDLNSVFRLDLIGEDKRKMDAVRAMLRQKYWFGCHFTYKHNVAVEKKVSFSSMSQCTKGLALSVTRHSF